MSGRPSGRSYPCGGDRDDPSGTRSATLTELAVEAFTSIQDVVDHAVADGSGAGSDRLRSAALAVVAERFVAFADRLAESDLS